MDEMGMEYMLYHIKKCGYSWRKIALELRPHNLSKSYFFLERVFRLWLEQKGAVSFWTSSIDHRPRSNIVTEPGYHRHAAEQAAAASNHRGSSKGTPLPTNADTNDTAGVQDVLGPKHDTGVSKKKKKQKPMKRQQRLRKEKGVERAEAVMDQLENKINKSKSRGKTVKNRRVSVSLVLNAAQVCLR